MPNSTGHSITSSISNTISSISSTFTSPRSTINKYLVYILLFIILSLGLLFVYIYITNQTRQNEISYIHDNDKTNDQKSNN